MIGLLPGRSVAEQLHEHQGIVGVAHVHAPRNGVAQVLVGGGGVWGMGRSWPGFLVQAGLLGREVTGGGTGGGRTVL